MHRLLCWDSIKHSAIRSAALIFWQDPNLWLRPNPTFSGFYVSEGSDAENNCKNRIKCTRRNLSVRAFGERLNDPWGWRRVLWSRIMHSTQGAECAKCISLRTLLCIRLCECVWVWCIELTLNGISANAIEANICRLWGDLFFVVVVCG